MAVHVQNRHRHDERISRAMLRAITALVTITLVGVTVLRLSGVEPVSQPPKGVAEVQVARVVFVELPGGGTDLMSADGSARLTGLAEGKDGFVRGVLRALYRVRMQHGVAESAPVELVRWADGRASLRDPSTQWAIELKGFGQDNLAVFAHLMSDIRDKREDH